jgi:hypothetical protein
MTDVREKHPANPGAIEREEDIARRAAGYIGTGLTYEEAREAAEEDRQRELHDWLHETPDAGYSDPGPGEGRYE